MCCIRSKTARVNAWKQCLLSMRMWIKCRICCESESFNPATSLQFWRFQMFTRNLLNGIFSSLLVIAGKRAINSLRCWHVEMCKLFKTSDYTSNNYTRLFKFTYFIFRLSRRNLFPSAFLSGVAGLLDTEILEFTLIAMSNLNKRSFNFTRAISTLTSIDVLIQ